MKKILILAVLLMMLAAPVLAAAGGSPNGHSRDSTAYYAYEAWWGCAYPDVGYSTIGCIVSSGDYPKSGGVGGVSYYAHEYKP